MPVGWLLSTQHEQRNTPAACSSNTLPAWLSGQGRRAGYPSDGSSVSESELMQYRRPVGIGPSSKTCPRCPPHRLQVTSVRVMPWLLSGVSTTFSSSAGCVKLGQPQCDSNLLSEANNSAPQPAQRYMPSCFVRLYSPVHGRSVPFSRST